jgi:outer membrane protein OmpA-like peptidoglycan-associated protein
MQDGIVIGLRDADNKVQNLVSGQRNSITVQTHLTVTVIEMEDINFHFDSAVLLPDYGTDEPQSGNKDQDRITGIAVLYACYKQAQEKGFQQKILVAGHTDKKGGEYYNLTLSQKRSENVFYMFTVKRTEWVNSSDDKFQVEDVQQILKWISFNFQYDCDPGKITNEMNAETENALLNFQKRYNIDFVTLNIHQNRFDHVFTKIKEDGKMGKQTWGAFFDIYMLELLITLGIKESGLYALRDRLQFVKKSPPNPAPTVGCGENFPESGATTEEQNPVDRRVEILFFDDGEEPRLACHPRKYNCIKSKCDLYPKDVFYKHDHIQAKPLPLPSGVAVRVHLKFSYKTPEDDSRPFPKGFPYILRYQDDSFEEKTIDSDNGQVFLQILREKKTFTLEFAFSETHYLASPKDSSQKDELVIETEVRKRIDTGFKVFSLPLKFNLKNSSWEMSPTPPNYDDNDKSFKNLDDLSIENIGSEASPIELTLDPHWQYIKLLYFDRWIKKKLSLPPIIVEAFSNKSKESGKAEIICNWITPTEASQSIPWILQETSKPDNNILLRIRAKENTYIESSGDDSNFSRRLVTQGTASASADISLNFGASVNINFDFANAFRLRYYDLPILWKSSKYFCQLSGGKDQPAQKVGKFEELASEKTEDAKPLIFSLDDIVLTDKNLNPIDWIPDSQLKNRIAVFCNTFSNEGPQSDLLSAEGLYKPDGKSYINKTDSSKKLDTPKDFTKNNYGYFTQLPEYEKTRNYISDYPDWTRLIFARGNAFEVFDKRTVEGKGDVIGARAAVNHLDVYKSNNTFVPPGNQRPHVNQLVIEKTPFFQTEPLFAQNHVVSPEIGRVDILRLRCSSVNKDNETEIGCCFMYFRFYFNFNATFKPAFNPNGVPINLTDPKDKEWIQTAIINLLYRWNGPAKSVVDLTDKTVNPGALFVIPGNGDKYKSKVILYGHLAEKDMAHYEIGVFKDAGGMVRPYMQSVVGIGALDGNHNQQGSNGWFYFAHETGHGTSLPDEYIEPLTPFNLNSFDCNSPGSPYSFDFDSLMNRNIVIRTRHYWHIAEWFRLLDGDDKKYFLQQSKSADTPNDFFKYKLPHRDDAPYKNFIGYSLQTSKDVELSDHGKFDLYHCLLGQDYFSSDFLPKLTDKNGDIDSLLMVIVKMKFNFETDNIVDISDFLHKIDTLIDLRFNFKIGFKGNAANINIKRGLIHFSPRYYVKHYSKNEPKDNNEHFNIKITPAKPPEWDSGLLSDSHYLFFPLSSPSGFTRYFVNMIGLNEGDEKNASSYSPIVQKIIPSANVFKYKN